MLSQTYLITGSTGIGAETARQLAKLGHRLFIVSRNPTHVEKIATELLELHAEVETSAGDLPDPCVGPAAIAKCVEKSGRLDGLYSVAGISARKFGDGPLHQCTEEGWQTVMNTNATTQYRMCRESLANAFTRATTRNGAAGSHFEI